MATTTSTQTNGVHSETSNDQIPKIKLDFTIFELFAAESDGPVKETICHFKPNADKRYKEIPFNNKFLITSTSAADSRDVAHLQLENVSTLLMFPMGAGQLVYIACDGSSDDPSLGRDAIHSTAVRNFEVLDESQRPSITTYKNAQDFIDNHKGNPIRWGFAIDFAEKIPSLFSPELVYKLNSKRFLAKCSVKSPNDRIIDCNCICADHTTEHNLWYHGGESCSTCSKGVEAEIDRVRKLLEDIPPPFVLKLTQCLGSVGTHIVQNEEEKKETIDYITKENLPAYLPRIAESNAHVYSTALVLSDFIKGDTWALNFFIRKDGSPIFVGACNQLTTRKTGGRQATCIIFAEQAELEKKFMPVLREIGQVLHDEGGGYYGPIGADIMIHPDDGTHYTIDLNVRVPTSYPLYLLKGHCGQRGFGVATVYECIIMSLSREDYQSKFRKEFVEGRIVLIGCIRLGEKEAWAYPTILCGETREACVELSKRILHYEVGGEAAREAGGG